MINTKILLSLLFVLGDYSYSVAQEINISGKISPDTNRNEQSKYFLRVEGGTVDIYESEDTGNFYAIRLIKSVAKEDRIRIDFGFISVDAAEGFEIAEAGLEWLVFPRALISPYIGGGVGIIKYEILYGLVYRWNAGISLKLGRIYLRFTMQKGTQVGGVTSFTKGDKGPNYFGVGVDFGI